MKAFHRRSVTMAGAGLLLLVTGCAAEERDPAGGPGPSSTGPVRKAAPTTTLPLKSTPHHVTWTDGDDRSHRLLLTPKHLARGAESDMDGLRLDEELQGMVPHYLTVSFTNTGKDTLRQPDPLKNLSVVLADGSVAPPVTLLSGGLSAGGTPSTCRDTGPDELGAGDKGTDCRIFMLPEDEHPTTVAYYDDDGEEGGARARLWDVAGEAEGAAAERVLPAGERVLAVWKDSSDADVTMRARPKSIRKGSVRELARFDLDRGEKEKAPYYVSVEYENTGDRDLYPDMQEGIVLRTAGGRQVQKMTLLDIGGPGVTQCPERTPNAMVRPGGKVTQCSVHLVPKGDRPLTLALSGRGGEAHTHVWKADVDD